jgi:phosphate starvation-inducible protein PhoH and related proteins
VKELSHSPKSWIINKGHISMAKKHAAKSKSRRDRNFQDIAESTQPMREKSARLRASEAWARNEAKPLVCRNQAQKEYLALMMSKLVTAGIGPAGTGKTFLCVKYAAQQLDKGRFERIIVVRPIVEAGGGLGYLKGGVEEKTAPYQTPFLEVLEEHYGKSHVEAMMTGPHPRILFVPLEFIRGRTFKDDFVILDEAQNTTCEQMETFLTRLGDGAQYVIQGDLNQVDIKDRTGRRARSGLLDALEILEGMDAVGVKYFVEEDIVRSGLCREIALRYRQRRIQQELDLQAQSQKQ